MTTVASQTNFQTSMTKLLEQTIDTIEREMGDRLHRTFKVNDEAKETLSSYFDRRFAAMKNDDWSDNAHSIKLIARTFRLGAGLTCSVEYIIDPDTEGQGMTPAEITVHHPLTTNKWTLHVRD